MAVCTIERTPREPRSEWLTEFETNGTPATRLTKDRYFRWLNTGPHLFVYLFFLIFSFFFIYVHRVAQFNIGNEPTNFEIRRVRPEMLSNLGAFSLTDTECQWSVTLRACPIKY